MDLNKYFPILIYFRRNLPKESRTDNRIKILCLAIPYISYRVLFTYSFMIRPLTGKHIKTLPKKKTMFFENSYKSTWFLESSNNFDIISNLPVEITSKIFRYVKFKVIYLSIFFKIYIFAKGTICYPKT